jgi:hypothetical protein
MGRECSTQLDDERCIQIMLLGTPEEILGSSRHT